MSGLVEAAIEEALGPRCLDYDQDCTGCKTWAEFDRLTARVAELEGALTSSRCPRPAQGRPDDLTVADCMACLECGCEFGAVLGRNTP